MKIFFGPDLFGDDHGETTWHVRRTTCHVGKTKCLVVFPIIGIENAFYMSLCFSTVSDAFHPESVRTVRRLFFMGDGMVSAGTGRRGT